MKSFLIQARWIFACLLILAGCAKGPDRNIEKRIFVDRQTLDLYVGDEFQLTASPTNTTFFWESLDHTVATVSQAGVVHAAGVGDTYIMVSMDDENAVVRQIPVDVSIPSAFKFTGKSGLNRVAVDADIRNNRIQAIKLTRTDTGESQITDVDFQDGVISASFEGLPDGTFTFDVVCLDKYGNESVPATLRLRSYDEANLTPRDIEISTVFGNALIVHWAYNPENYVKVTYLSTNGKEVTVDVDELVMYLYDFQPFPAPSFRYVTYYDLGEFVYENERVVSGDDFTHNKLYILNSSSTLSNPHYIWARDFDMGGEGVAFHKGQRNTTLPEYQDYRKGLGDLNDNWVVITDRDGSGANSGVGNILGTYPPYVFYNIVGDWYRYTVYVEDAGFYDIAVEAGAGGTYQGRLIVDGVEGVDFAIPQTNWSCWNFTFHVPTPSKLELSQGVHTIGFKYQSGSSNGSCFKGMRLYWSPN